MKSPDCDQDRLDVLKDPFIDCLFLEGAIEPLCDSVGFRLADKRKAGVDAPVLGLVQEMVRQILGAMVQAEREPPRHAGLSVAIDVTKPHRDWLQSRIAVAVLGHLPANAFGVPMLDSGKQPNVSVIDGEDSGSVGAPRHTGRLGDDVARVLVARRLPASIRTQQPALPPDAETPLARDTNLIENTQTRPHLAVALALKRGSGQIRLNPAQ